MHGLVENFRQYSTPFDLAWQSTSVLLRTVAGHGQYALRHKIDPFDEPDLQKSSSVGFDSEQTEESGYQQTQLQQHKHRKPSNTIDRIASNCRHGFKVQYRKFHDFAPYKPTGESTNRSAKHEQPIWGHSEPTQAIS